MKERKQKSILVLWKEGAYAQALKAILRPEDVVTSCEELRRIDFQKNDYLGIVVPAELTWENHAYFTAS
jgi:hypothetical protein